mmetsp:Transcript_43680/g.111655  ORF Transcript_43680/g.111655 Transcript_43680/m.111655 type:complete len:202 (+) Transcript_43680:241-846(+)
MISGPPGSSTVAVRSDRPSRTAATTVAQAPVPHARVGPAPRSHTRIFRYVGDTTSVNSVLIRAGNAALFSKRGPISARLSLSTSSGQSFPLNTTACGLPMLTVVTVQVMPLTSRVCATAAPDWELASRVVGTLAGSRMGSPMSTQTCPSGRMSGTMRPASVCTLWVCGPPPSMSETNRARQRIPLPHISGSLPSELKILMV